MKHPKQTVVIDRLNSLERRVRLYHRLALGFGLIVIAAACLAARHDAAKPMTLRATRLEVVNASGQVVLRAGFDTDGGTLRLWTHDGKLRFGAYATRNGGRLEVLNREGYERFSVGPQRETDLQGLWERHLLRFEQNTRQTNRLTQEVHSVENRLQALAQPRRPDISGAQQERDIDRLQAAFNQQRSRLEQLRSRLDRLDQQVRRLDRR